jgi:hypothetical protein
MGHEEDRGQEEHEGERYLRMLGLEELVDQQIPGRSEKMRDFLDICGDHARPMLIGLEQLDPGDPRYNTARDALRDYIGQFVAPEEG